MKAALGTALNMSSVAYTVTRSYETVSKYEEEEEASSSSDSDSDDELDIHEIIRQGNLAEIKEAIARDRPKYIAKKDKVCCVFF